MDNLETMRIFFQAYPEARPREIRDAVSEMLAPGKSETPSRKSELAIVAGRFRLSWSHYVLLVRARSDQARDFYESRSPSW